MKLTLIALIALAAVTTAVDLASADDFLPPDWRGDPLTIMAEWTFVQDFTDMPMLIAPEEYQQVGDGVHSLGPGFVYAEVSDEVEWIPDYEEPGDGIAITFWEPGTITIYLPNWDVDYQYKYIRVQIAYGDSPAHVTSVLGPNPIDGTWTDPSVGELVETIEVDITHHRAETWLLQPNPFAEYIHIAVPEMSHVDGIVIDTISSPEAVAVEQRSWSAVKNLFD